MIVDFVQPDRSLFLSVNKAVDTTNPFLGGECVLKKCCKKYKKGKRCKKCPD